ncbi:ubiquinol-cytochrome C reductase complex core protein 2 precursor [Moesziomyces antarcticus]|uniref:Cytochrome b-c1 complex subunit 2, mitochondrial n=1 Tax=Pseudozyma antarctica TaxID=84753 RepID=A0A5C3FK34_PSEA2|nr:ubiquinol-cytochrome C reductase complex core protein 2 precursor [Moesziomyces antarcticus]GAK63308.1 ubiquinol-cytochrome C reductase complex core protein 2 precursor [Moesziomyces antarcticus]SPO43891.1 probable QCR2 - 40 kDa ubiquinol cytochrome-c reductase core protein 2 [Moesziomyces antarcticus]
MSFARSAAPVRTALRTAANQQRAFTTANAAGVKTAAADDGALTSTVTVAIKAGSRYESAPGVAHVLKNYLFKSNQKRSALRLVREAEFYGGVLSTALTKEHLLLTAEFLRGDEEFFVEALGDVLSKSKFAAHEFNEEVLPQVQAEYAQAQSNPAVLGYDSLLQTAYRQRSLGHSLFASPASPITHRQTVDFAHAAFAKDNIAVLGSGIDSAKLNQLVSAHFGELAASASVSSTPAKYFGGEQRVAFAAPHGAENTRAAHGHFFVGFEGAGHKDAEASANLAVLRALLGGESSVKWSNGVSPLSQIAESIPGARAAAFNLTFSDSGVFGAHVSAPSASVQQAASKVAQALKNVAGGLKEEAIKAAVAKAKFERATVLENRTAAHELVSAQLLEAGSVATLENAFAALDAVKPASLSKVAEKLLKSKPTTVAVGDVHKLPYADEVL